MPTHAGVGQGTQAKAVPLQGALRCSGAGEAVGRRATGLLSAHAAVGMPWLFGGAAFLSRLVAHAWERIEGFGVIWGDFTSGGRCWAPARAGKGGGGEGDEGSGISIPVPAATGVLPTEKAARSGPAGQDAPCNLCNAQRLQEYSALHPRNFIHSLLTLIPHPAAGMGSLLQMGKLRHGAFCELELTRGKIQESEQHLCCGQSLLSPRAFSQGHAELAATGSVLVPGLSLTAAC